MTRRWLTAIVVVSAICAVLCVRTPDAGLAWRSGFVAAIFIWGSAGFALWKRGEVSRQQVILVAVLLRIAAFPLLPTISDDGYRYIWDGTLHAQEGVNPYAFKPSDPALDHLHNEPIFDELNSADFYSVYPPTSQIAFAIGGLAYPLGWMASWFLIKLLFLSAELLAIVLLARLVSSKALMLYTWHPLAVIEIAGQAHTEALAVCLLIVAVRAARQKKRWLSGFALAVAGWVKLVPFFAIPAAVRRLGWKGIGAAIVAFGLLMFPYFESYTVPNIRESLDLYVQYFEFNAGPYFVLKGFSELVGLGDVSKILGPLLRFGFLLSVGGMAVVSYLRSWQVETVLLATFSLFVLFSTTVHPWYVLPLLVLAPLFVDRSPLKWIASGWLGFGLLSMGTYLIYVGPPATYWFFVVVSWLFLLALIGYGVIQLALPSIMRRRASSKVNWIVNSIPDVLPPNTELLDLGAGDGYVGESLHQMTGADVQLADVVDFNKTDLSLTIYDGQTLPFNNDSFDSTIISYVLHHANDAGSILREAKRVTSGPIVILESIYKGQFQHWLLDKLDRLANRLRSGGLMKAYEEHLNFRTDGEWRELFTGLDLKVQHTAYRGRWIHRQVLYVLGV